MKLKANHVWVEVYLMTLEGYESTGQGGLLPYYIQMPKDQITLDSVWQKCAEMRNPQNLRWAVYRFEVVDQHPGEEEDEKEKLREQIKELEARIEGLERRSLNSLTSSITIRTEPVDWYVRPYNPFPIELPPFPITIS